MEEGHLVRQGEAVPGMALNQSVPDGVFALAGVVHIGCVKVGVAPLQEGVHHGADLLQVNSALLLGVGHGKAHHTKAKFFHVRFSLF